MDACLTNYGSSLIVDLFLGGQTYRPADTVQVGLSLTPPNAVGLIVEPDDPAYRRVIIPNDRFHFPPAVITGGVKTNAKEIRFPKPSRLWGRVRSVFVAEGKTGAVLAMAESLCDADVGPGDGPKIAAGSLRLRMG